MVAQRVVVGMAVHVGAGPRARQRVLDDLADPGVRAVGHQHDLVRQQDRFVDVVGDHEHGLLRARADRQQLVLQAAAGQRIQRAERFVQQQGLGLDGQRPGDADALIYRFYELIQVYGTTIKALIEEEFGDGIMSAIDFSMDIDREADPKGDRVVVTLNGKFLPYRTY